LRTHQLDGENTICGRWWVTERSSLQRKPLSDQLTNAKVGSTVGGSLSPPSARFSA